MRLRAAVLSVLLLVTGVAANAATSSSGGDLQHELVLNAQNTGLSFSDPVFSINISGGYRYKLTDMFQLTVQAPGGSTGVAIQFGGQKIKAVQLLAGPTINFGDNMWNALYVTLGAGVQYLNATSTTTGTSASATNLLFGGAIGKRNNIYNGFNWSPELWIWKSTSSTVNSNLTFALNLLSFSYAF